MTSKINSRLKPTSRRLLQTLGAFALTAASSLSAGSPDKAPLQEPVIEPQALYLGTFNTGVKTSDVYTEGNLSFVVPVWSSLGSDGTLAGGTVFLSPYVSLGEQGELATSLGLGWRYLFNDQSVSALKAAPASTGFLTEGFYVGANVFVDNLRTQFDNHFWQLGIGAEIGSRYLEVRGNYYLPLTSGQKLAERTTSTEKFTTRSQSNSTRIETSGDGVADPFATGNTIQQDVDLTSTAVTTTRSTTTTTTVKTITSLFEEGMEGWDIETAVLVPGLDRYLDITLLAGYYSFDNQPFGPQRGGSGNTEGFKLGLEVRPVPAVVLTGTWYEDEGLTGSDWVAGVGLQIPLGKEWKDAFKSRRRHLAERLAEPVARQNAAIKTSRSYDVDQDVSQSSRTTTHVRRRIINQSKQRITIAEDIVFVNNGDAVGNGIQAGSADGDGTAESPFDTIQQAADLAAANHVNTQRVWNVYTQGTGNVYHEAVTITSSTKFTSSYVGIKSSYGGTFGGDTERPLVRGGFGADSGSDAFLTSPVDSLVEVKGYKIDPGEEPEPIPNATGHGIYMNAIQNVVIADNEISKMTDGVSIEGNGLDVYFIHIARNVIADNTSEGIYLHPVGADVFGDILNNEVSDNGRENMQLEVEGGSFIANIIGNTANGSNGEVGIHIQAISFRGLIADNTTNGNGEDGLKVELYGGDFIGSVLRNESNGNGDSGIVLYDVADFVGDFAFNQADGNDDYGIIFRTDNFQGDLTGNRASINTLAPLVMLVYENMEGNISGNVFENNGELGSVQIDGDLTGNIFNNRVLFHSDTPPSSAPLTIGGAFNGIIYDNDIDIVHP
jgi:hypothetical protein